MTEFDGRAPRSDVVPPADTAIPTHRRRAVVAWASWDWGSSAYSTIVVSFVFAPYLANTVGGPDAALGLSGATWLAISTAVAGVLIAGLAPVTGQRADEGDGGAPAWRSSRGWSSSARSACSS